MKKKYQISFPPCKAKSADLALLHGEQRTQNMRRKISSLLLLGIFVCASVSAQEKQQWVKVDRSQLPDSILPEEITFPQPTDDKYRVVTNRFWENWFVYADGGGHAFFGDYSHYGKFKETLGPEFTVGLGKWFTPGLGIKAQFGMGASRGFMTNGKISTSNYGALPNPYMVTDVGNYPQYHNGKAFWPMKTKYWDVSLNATLNLSRLFCAWEDYGTKKLFNQFILTLGFGGIHHYDYDKDKYGPENDWYMNAELQYSRFFTRAKAFSLDFKVRSQIFETHFDQSFIQGHRWDANLGVALGLTYYIKVRGWDRCVSCGEANYYIPVPPQGDCPEYKTFTFYVFYPNNYSGRDDAPVIAGDAVNAIDYLAGGIFTQKKFVNTNAVDANLSSSAKLRRQATEDIATEKATFGGNQIVTRGYEISKEPISLSMSESELKAFKDKYGYYYAPIYEGSNTWYYRVDDVTATQKLLSDDNYKESESYSLNAHAGLGTVRQNMPLDKNTDLYSFADVYAAIEGNNGYISKYADAKTVATIKEILESGTILSVQAEGLATSQDNNKENEVGLQRNNTLSHNRALTAIKWLQGCGKFNGVPADAFSVNSLNAPIGQVNDKSTRGLNAKLNRCARIKVSYLINKK